MTELNRAQLQAWETSLGMAATALDYDGAGPARLRGRLRNTMSALRESVETVRRLCETVVALRRELLAEEGRAAGIVDPLPIPYLVTSADGAILRVNQAAAAAVNVSARALVGRNILVFLDERETWMQVLAEVTVSGIGTRRAGKLRPRERLQAAVVANLSVCDAPEGPAVQWFLTEGLTEQAMQGGRRCTPRPSTPSSPPIS